MSPTTLEFKVVRVHKMPDGSALKAFIDMSVNDSLLIKGLRIVDGKGGVFVSMPQEQGKDKRWYDSILCLKPEVREDISQKVLSAYQSS